MKNKFFAIFASLSVLLLSSCGSSSTTTTYTIGGTLSGLVSGGSITLQNNSGNDLPLTADGSFTFTTGLANAVAYSVAVSTQPTGQTCTVTNGSGTVSSANVTNVAVTCVDNKIIFVTTSGNNGNLGGVTGADALCAADSSCPSGATCKAFIVDGTTRVACTTADCSGGPSEHTDWVLAASTTYYRSDGTTVIGTTTANGIFTFPLTNTINDDGNLYWTGFRDPADWVAASDRNCSNWANSLGVLSGNIGDPSTTSISIVAKSATPPGCDTTLKLLCVEQ